MPRRAAAGKPPATKGKGGGGVPTAAPDVVEPGRAGGYLAPPPMPVFQLTPTEVITTLVS